jgi:phosphate starvation-inducible PhoH-like protein
MIFEGDINQIDNKNIRKGKEISGLNHAKESLAGLEGIGFVDFSNAEIVRNPLITKILERWDPEVYGG